MQFVCVGDLHIEKEKFLIKEACWYTPIKHALDQVVEYCHKNKIKNIILLGDVFETPFPQQDSIVWLFNYLNLHKDLKWEIILGNHDFLNKKLNSLLVLGELSAGSNIRVHQTPLLEKYKSFNLYYCPFPHKAILPEYKHPNPTVCFGHFEINGSQLDNGMIVKDKHELKILKKDLWIMGHLHTRHKVGRCLYVGTPLQRGFLEDTNRSFTHVKIVEGVPQYKAVPLTVYYHLNKKVVDTKQELRDLFKQHQANMIYWIKIKEGLEPALLKWIRDHDVKIYKTLLETETVQRVESKIDQRVEINLLTGVEEFLQERYNLDPKSVEKVVNICKMNM
jgi:DNA repair exonuclease SbcCD nuclease subunit